MIVKGAKGYYVVSHDGKKLSKEYKKKADAKKRMREIEYYKAVKK